MSIQQQVSPTPVLAADERGFAFRQHEHWSGRTEWSARDTLLDINIEHAATKSEARQRIAAHRAAFVAEGSPEWRREFRALCAAQRAFITSIKTGA